MSPFLVILGATATGKSSLALAVAESLGGEIVNADALQVYRGFDIGTAKPSAAERERVPHHLLDIVDPREQFSVGEFCRIARPVIADIQGRGALPIVVGGSGLYVRSLLEGLSPLPPSEPGMRARLTARLESEGLGSLRGELAELDPVTETRLASGDTQRVLRALEVALSTGRPLSDWISADTGSRGTLDAVRIGLTLQRPILYDRVERRVAKMVETGWVSEVESLLRTGLTTSAPAFTAIGYRQMASHLEGELSLEEAIQRTVGATRRFAKRQSTWFRRETEVRWLDALAVERDRMSVLELVRGRLGGQK